MGARPSFTQSDIPEGLRQDDDTSLTCVCQQLLDRVLIYRASTK
jgi:hypothetical protein